MKKFYKNFELYKAVEIFLICSFILIVAGPFLILIFKLLDALFKGNNIDYTLFFPSGKRFTLFLRSANLSFITSFSDMLAGFFTALFLWQYKKIKSYKYLLFVFITIPNYVHVLAWTNTFNDINQIFQFFNFDSIILSGNLITCFVQFMAYYPITTALCLLGLELIPVEYIESAKLYKKDSAILFKIITPLAFPFIIAGGIFIFLITIMDYTIPSLYQINVYSMEIFADYSTYSDGVRAFQLSVPLIVLATFVIFTFKKYLKAIDVESFKIKQCDINFKLPLPIYIVQCISVILFILQIIVPLFQLFSLAIKENFVQNVIESINELKYTFLVSIIAALVAVILSFVVAEYMNKGSKILWILNIVPFVIPASLSGIGIIMIYNRSILGAVYGSSLMSILATCARFIPFSVLILTFMFKQEDKVLIDAANIYKKSEFMSLVKIKIPLFIKSILASFVFVFVFSAQELGASLMVVPPGKGTITMKIYNYMHYGATGKVASLCLFMTIISLVCGAVILYALRNYNKVKSEDNF